MYVKSGFLSRWQETDSKLPTITTSPPYSVLDLAAAVFSVRNC